MPRIREIGSQVGVSGAVGGRAASAQDFGASIGQAVEGFGQVLEGASDAIQKRVKQSEYSDYYASHAEKQAEWIEKFRTELKSAKPGDSEFASRMMTAYQEDMAKLGENATQLEVKEYIKRSNAESTAQFFKLAQSGQAELAAVQQSQNFDKGIQADSVVLSADPTQLQSKLSGLESYLGTLELEPEQREVLRQKGRETLVSSAVKGYIEINPEKAISDISSGKLDTFFKDGVQKDRFLSEAREERNRRFYEDERIRREKERQDELVREETKTSFIDKQYSGKGLTTKEIKESNLTAAEKEHFYRLVSAKKHDITDNQTYTSFLKRIHGIDENNASEPTDVELIQAVTDKKIDLQALQFLRNERLGKNSVEGKDLSVLKKTVLKSAEQAFKGTGYIKNPTWADDMAEFTRAMQVKEAEYRRKNIPLSELYDPQGADFVKIMSQFRKSDKDILKQQSAQIGGAVDRTALLKKAPIEDRVPQDENGNKDHFSFALKERLAELDPTGNRQRVYSGFKERVEKELKADWEIYQDYKKNPRRYNAWTASKMEALFEDILPDALDMANDPRYAEDPETDPNVRGANESIADWKKRTGRN